MIYVDEGAYDADMARSSLRALKKAVKEYRASSTGQCSGIIQPLNASIDFQIGEFSRDGSSFFVAYSRPQDMRVGARNLVGMLAWAAQWGKFNVGFYRHKGDSYITVSKPPMQEVACA